MMGFVCDWHFQAVAPAIMCCKAGHAMLVPEMGDCKGYAVADCSGNVGG